ncbi:PLP-dependent aspartate aminotransferase family protein [Oscillospiraceae bacterium PP1C4]
MQYKNDDKLIATHLGDDYDQFLGAVVPPVFMNSLHVFPTMEQYFEHDKYTDFVYGRVSNPTVHIVEQKIAAMERASHAALFASGMAAATTAISVSCRAGSHVICLKNCYGPVVTFLEEYCIKKMNMQVTYVSGTVEEIKNAMRSNTDLIILESPTSLVFEVVDLKKIAAIAKENGTYTYIDNTYCTPLYQKPITLGIDMVMHTLSKYLGGHSDLIGGVLACNNEELGRQILDCRELYGGTMGPQEAWLVMRGIRTLDVRLERHQETAMKVARYLEGHPRINKVHYPGLPSHPQYDLAQAQQTGSCGLLSFELNATKEEAVQVCNRLKLFKIGVSWGGFESLVVMPMYKRTPEQAAFYGTVNQLIRIHCGLEGAENLIADLEQALKSL